MKVYYTLNSVELGEESKADSLNALYEAWQYCKQDDKETGDSKTYYFAQHELDESNGKETIREGKIYKRGDKIFFKDINKVTLRQNYKL
jgi:hypothetical protein